MSQVWSFFLKKIFFPPFITFSVFVLYSTFYCWFRYKHSDVQLPPLFAKQNSYGDGRNKHIEKANPSLYFLNFFLSPIFLLLYMTKCYRSSHGLSTYSLNPSLCLKNGWLGPPQETEARKMSAWPTPASVYLLNMRFPACIRQPSLFLSLSLIHTPLTSLRPNVSPLEPSVF